MVWNTYQCYLKAAKDTISSEMEVVKSLGKCFGAKLVRGAYMDKERKLAKINVRVFSMLTNKAACVSVIESVSLVQSFSP